MRNEHVTFTWISILLWLLEYCSASFHYDFCVVGSGTGGVVATRLAQAKYNVLLIEAGPDDKNFSCTSCDALPFGDLIAGTPLLPFKGHWFFRVEQLNWMNTTSMPSYWNYNKTTLSRTVDLNRAKILGGCISHNGGSWTRGNVRDYDYVAQHLNLENWSFENILPFYQKLETYSGENTTYRGDTGPINIIDIPLTKYQYKLKAFVDTAIQYGLPYNNNQHGGYSQYGVGLGEFNVAQYTNNKTGLFNTTHYRSSVSQSYIRDIGIPSDHLTVWYNTTVQRVLFDDTKPKPKAIGIEYYDSNSGDLQSVYCNKEVIISAGTYQSPQLLMLSGIGPVEEMNKFNITSIYEHDAVGRNGQDHSYVFMSYRVNETVLGIENLTIPRNFSIRTYRNTTEYFEFNALIRTFLSTNSYDRLGYDYNDISLYVFNGGITSSQSDMMSA
eukprot:515500_1